MEDSNLDISDLQSKCRSLYNISRFNISPQLKHKTKKKFFAQYLSVYKISYNLLIKTRVKNKRTNPGNIYFEKR